MGSRKVVAAVFVVGLLVLGVFVLFLNGDPRPVASDGSKQVELCGYGPIAPVRSTTDYPLAVRQAADQAMATIAKDLQANPRPQDQAIGLYAQLVAAVGKAGDEDARNFPGDCSDDRCTERRWKAARAAALPHAEAAARLAITSQDPDAYAMALHACKINREGACAELSTAHWAQLDPDNAIPWLSQADEALARNDSAAVATAVSRASRAKESNLVWPSILMLGQHPIARKLEPAPRLLLLSQVFGIYAAFPIPGYRTVHEWCTPEAMKDFQTRQLCRNLATMMSERGGSITEFALGASLGERSGWTAERVQYVRDQIDAINFVEAAALDVNDVHSCRFLEKLEQRTVELLTIGEMGAVRQKIAATNQPVTALAHQWRERRSTELSAKPR